MRKMETSRSQPGSRSELLTRHVSRLTSACSDPDHSLANRTRETFRLLEVLHVSVGPPTQVGLNKLARLILAHERSRHVPGEHEERDKLSAPSPTYTFLHSIVGPSEVKQEPGSNI